MRLVSGRLMVSLPSRGAREFLPAERIHDLSELDAIDALWSHVDYALWAGDLNYRLEMERDEVLAMLSAEKLGVRSVQPLTCCPHVVKCHLR